MENVVLLKWNNFTPCHPFFNLYGANAPSFLCKLSFTFDLFLKVKVVRMHIKIVWQRMKR